MSRERVPRRPRRIAGASSPSHSDSARAASLGNRAMQALIQRGAARAAAALSMQPVAPETAAPVQVVAGGPGADTPRAAGDTTTAVAASVPAVLDEYQVPFSTAVYYVGDARGPNVLMDIVRGIDGQLTFRWYAFDDGRALHGMLEQWAALADVVFGFASHPQDFFAILGRALAPREWRALWPNPTVELLDRIEHGALALPHNIVLRAHNGWIRAEPPSAGG
jgi:hypothetical protein